MITALVETLAPYMPVFMLIAAVGAGVIGWLAKAVSVRALRERVRRMSRDVRVLTEQRDTAEADLREERDLVGDLADDLAETRRALRSVIGDPLTGGTHHVALDHVRTIAARPLPGESTGAHAALPDTEQDPSIDALARAVTDQDRGEL